MERQIIFYYGLGLSLGYKYDDGENLIILTLPFVIIVWSWR